MAKKSKLDAYLASTSAAKTPAQTPAPAPAPRKLAPLRPTAAPVVSDADAAVVADALVGPPLADDPAAPRTIAGPPPGPATIGPRLSVRGLGEIAIMLWPDGTPDRAVVAFNGQQVAKWRRTSPRDAACRWWLERGLGGTEATRLLDALDGVTRRWPMASVIDAATPPPVPPPAANTASTSDAAPASADPGVCVFLAIVRATPRDAAAIESAALAELQRGAEGIGAWSAAAWIEGRAVTLFGPHRVAALAAAAALRAAVVSKLRAAPEPRATLDVDSIMGAIGGGR